MVTNVSWGLKKICAEMLNFIKRYSYSYEAVHHTLI